MKLKSVKPSSDPDKKLDVTIEQPSGREKTIRIGAKGMDDFTKTHDEEQKERYIARHKAREDWKLSGILTAGFWSKHLLWGDTTSLRKNIEITKKRFDL